VRLNVFSGPLPTLRELHPGWLFGHCVWLGMMGGAAACHVCNICVVFCHMTVMFRGCCWLDILGMLGGYQLDRRKICGI